MLGTSSKQLLISTGNETLNKFLGGGLLNSSLNIFERHGPSSRLLLPILNKSLMATTLSETNNIIYVNFSPLRRINESTILSSLPTPRKVKSELMYKDVRGKTASSTIKIAWRYSSRSSSPPSGAALMDQVDFGLRLDKEFEEKGLGTLQVIDVETESESWLMHLIRRLEEHISELSADGKTVNIVMNDLLDPMSPLIDDNGALLKFLYLMRRLARTIARGIISVSYDTSMCNDHISLRDHLYDLADCVVSFYSYETGESKLTGYKNVEGTLDYIKAPKINSFGMHFQRELSDWGYRLTNNHRFFVIDELSLPVRDEDDDREVVKKRATDVAKTSTRPLEEASPLEDFKGVAERVLSKQL